MKIKYIINLDEDERRDLEQMTRKGQAPVRRIKRAQILLHASEGKTDKEVAHSLRVAEATVFRTRRRFVEQGIEASLKEGPRPGKPRKLNGKQEAFLVALACSQPPEGRQSWTMQMLADQMVTLDIVDTLSDETVRRTLKRGKSSLGKGGNGACRKSMRTLSGGWKIS
jgi:transposase